jgi:hypothetical protein
MSEENESTGSSLKKTILGTIATVVTAGGAWLASTLFGGGDDKPQPVQQAPVINIQNTQTQTAAPAGKTVIIKEGGSVKPVDAPKPKKKEGDEFKEKPAAW